MSAEKELLKVYCGWNDETSLVTTHQKFFCSTVSCDVDIAPEDFHGGIVQLLLQLEKVINRIK